MSTRANILIQDGCDKLWFYRHSDGYPDGAMKTLQIFMRWVRDGSIRDNAGQASGWLVILGAMEYNTIPAFEAPPDDGFSTYGKPETFAKPKRWKPGSYEPTGGRHGDIAYLYVLDMPSKELRCYEAHCYPVSDTAERNDGPQPEDTLIFTDTAAEPWLPDTQGDDD